jgi:hypothetical protein
VFTRLFKEYGVRPGRMGDRFLWADG